MTPNRYASERSNPAFAAALLRRPVPLLLQVLVVAGAGLLAHHVRADEPTADQLTTPTRSVEVGVGTSSSASPKADEYDGVTRKGPYAIGNFDLRGGGAFNSNDATRWRLSGNNLGLDNRDVLAEYGAQGLYRITIGYDELLRNGSAVYPSISTPYVGVGTTTLTLPANWAAPLYTTSASMASGNNFPAPGASMLGLAATGYGSPLVSNTAFLCRSTTNGCAPNAALGGVYTTGLPVTAANTAMLAQNGVDLADFQSITLSTKRQKQSYSASYELSTRWSVNVGMQREDKKGLKPLGVVNSSNGGYAAENSVIIPQVIDTTTDQYTAAVNFKGEKSFLSLAYFGAMFENRAKAMTLDNPYGTGTYNGVTQTGYGISSATISAEPDSRFNQFRLTGGYDLGATTRLVADAAYSRNGQNSSYVLDAGMFATPTGAAGAAVNNGTVVPTNSANGLVVNRSLDLKLTARPLAALSLDAAYKYDDRDNQTPVNTYAWYDAGVKMFGTPGSVLNGATIPGIPTGTGLYGGVNIVANRPYSKKVNDLSADADYTVLRGHAVKVGLEWQSIDRSCTGTWIDCAAADTSRETTGRLEYRYRPGGDFSGRIGVDLARRHADYNPNAWMSLNPALNATNITNLAANGYTGSPYGFLQANGLTPYGLPLPANGTSPFTGNTLANYNLLFGTGNGGLSSAYYGNANTTQNWPGLDVYNVATRDRQRVRAAGDWRATEFITFQGSADYRHDNYPDSTYGLTSSSSWTLNLDGDLAVNEDLSFSGYVTHEDQRSTSGGDSASNGTVSAVASTAAATGTAYTTATGATGRNTSVVGLCAGDSAAGLPAGYTQYQLYNNNAKIAPCTNWQSQVKDRTDTIGLAFHKKHLVVEKVSLAGDLSFSHAVTVNSMTGGFYYANPQAAFVAGAPAVSFINAASLPDVVINALQLRLIGGYQVTKAGSVRVAYSFRRLQVNDYAYATTQPAYTSGTVMPAMSPAPDYLVNAVGISYLLTFQ